MIDRLSRQVQIADGGIRILRLERSDDFSRQLATDRTIGKDAGINVQNFHVLGFRLRMRPPHPFKRIIDFAGASA